MLVKFVFINGSEKVLTVNEKEYKDFANKACDFNFIIFDDIVIHMNQLLYFELVKGDKA